MLASVFLPTWDVKFRTARRVFDQPAAELCTSRSVRGRSLGRGYDVGFPQGVDVGTLHFRES